MWKRCLQGAVIALIAAWLPWMGPGAGAQEVSSSASDLERTHPKIQRTLEMFAEPIDVRSLDAVSLRGQATDKTLRWVQVVIELNTETAVNQVVDRVTQLGGVLETTHARLVQARVPTTALLPLAELEAVAFIRRPVYLQQTAAGAFQGSVVSEGVAEIGVAPWWQAGFTGEGVKVGIIDSFDGYTRLLGKELPPQAKVTTKSFTPNGLLYDPDDPSSHGTSVAEIIHDIAPNAHLYFAHARTGVEIENAVAWLIEQEIDVLNSSFGLGSGCLGNATGGYFEDNWLALRQQGITHVAAAGNEADQHWQDTWRDNDSDGFYNFTTSDEDNRFDVVVTRGEDTNGNEIGIARILGLLSWDAPCRNAPDDYEVVLFKQGANGTLQQLPAFNPNTGVGQASDWKLERGFPIKSFSAVDLWDASQIDKEVQYYYKLRKIRAAAANTLLDVVLPSCNCRNYEYQVKTGSISIGEPAMSPNAMAVAAVHHTPGRCGDYCTNGSLLFYSSQGPTGDGRTKPDIAAPTHVSTVSSGTWTGEGQNQNMGFSGTSAAAPHVAGAAALVLQAFPEFNPVQVQQFLEDRAEDLGAPGKDNLFGAGQLLLGQPPAAQGRPQTPSALKAFVQSDTTIALTWQDNAQNESGFRMERKQGGGGFRQLTLLERDRTAYTDTGLSSGTDYCYRVFAFNDRGDSDPSAEVCARTQPASDRTPPAAPLNVTVTPSGWSNQPVYRVDWTNPDDESKIVAAWYTLGKVPGAANDGTRTTNKPMTITVSAEGEQVLYLWLEDALGNVDHRNRAQAILRYDATAPQGALTIASGATTTGNFNVSLSVSATDKGGSGVSEMRFSNDGKAWSLWEPFQDNKSWELTFDLGEKTVSAQFRDRAGNVSPAVSDQIFLILSARVLGTFELAQPAELSIPQGLLNQLPQGAIFTERPHTTRGGQTSDALAEVGLRLDPTTGAILGAPTLAGQFAFLIEAQLNDVLVAEFWLSIAINDQTQAPQGITPLAPGEVQEGQVEPGELSGLYQLEVPQDTLALRVSARSLDGGNVDLYVRLNAPVLSTPTSVEADYASISPASAESLTISNPTSGTYFIALRNRDIEPQAYTLVVTVDPLIRIDPSPLALNTTTEGRVLDVVQYEVEVDGQTNALTILLESLGAGNLWLHLRYGEPVQRIGDTLVADWHSVTGGGTESITLMGAALRPGRYYIVVENPETFTQRFRLAANGT